MYIYIYVAVSENRVYTKSIANWIRKSTTNKFSCLLCSDKPIVSPARTRTRTGTPPPEKKTKLSESGLAVHMLDLEFELAVTQFELAFELAPEQFELDFDLAASASNSNSNSHPPPRQKKKQAFWVRTRGPHARTRVRTGGDTVRTRVRTRPRAVRTRFWPGGGRVELELELELDPPPGGKKNLSEYAFTVKLWKTASCQPGSQVPGINFFPYQIEGGRYGMLPTQASRK